jgi:hypothetical protein
MHAFAQSYSPEVEPQDRQAKAGEDLHRVIDHLVVHGSAAQRVRVAYERSETGIAASSIQDSFKLARRPAKVIDGANHRS